MIKQEKGITDSDGEPWRRPHGREGPGLKSVSKAVIEGEGDGIEGYKGSLSQGTA